MNYYLIKFDVEYHNNIIYDLHDFDIILLNVFI